MRPRYLRIIVTPRCSLACAYCHMEGDPARAPGRAVGFLAEVVGVAAGSGVDKIKLLGGEPLLRPDLAELVEALRRAAPRADLSLITGGVAPAGRLPAAFASGLDRANLSIHGWSLPAFCAKAGRDEAAWRIRQGTVAWLLAHGRPLKLNFVYTSTADEPDLDELLAWAARHPVVVNVLDDLGASSLGPEVLLDALQRLRGRPRTRRVEPDPSSLATLRLVWSDGLEVEVKHQRLGAVAPWAACVGCPVRARCREGIHAVRLTHDGWLRTCMDRPDIGVDLGRAWHDHGPAGVTAAWHTFLDGVVPAREAA